MERQLVIRNRAVRFGDKTWVMGILNCTPDSFYPESRKIALEDAVATARDMVACGVDLVDIGGESTRPGSRPISVEEEIDRICPVIESIRRESEVFISADTKKARVAEASLRSGADMINDVSGLRADPDMGRVLAEGGVPVVLMHMRGTPETMQRNPYYEDTVAEIEVELAESMARALEAGVQRDRIVLDPGIGFGKRLEDNLRIIRFLDRLKRLGAPLLIGISRKSFLGKILDLPLEERLVGTITANTVAVMRGADIVRVHDYREGVQMARVIDAILHVPER